MQAKSVRQAWQLLESSVVTFQSQAVGTVAAQDAETAALNYDQVFTRDFAISAFAFLLDGRPEIVRRFLEVTLCLQSQQRQLDCFKPGEGLMPASFKVTCDGSGEQLLADFGESSIAQVAPVDSGFWWLLILQAYVRTTDDRAFVSQQKVQQAIRLILDLCLISRFDMFPTMLVPDGSFMIDRRMGVYGYPLDIQAQFFAALRAASELLEANDPANESYRTVLDQRLSNLAHHVRTYYWLDLPQLNEIYRYGVEEYGTSSINKFNIYPDTIPEWLMDWLPVRGGYLAGNLGPGRLDYRWFGQGNLLACAGGLASPDQIDAILQLLTERADDLIGEVPLKLCFPALADHDWRVLTGCDRKNRPWSYHNGGHWPVLLWLLTLVSLQSGARDLAERALEAAERRLSRDDWPEYYDGRRGRLVGQQARRQQTWSAAGYLVACQLLEDPDRARQLPFSRSMA
ncbi:MULTISPECIES: glycoside hydrolase 100 family protein [Thiorhodovibrio]|uniref:glycoside hydrolase 100 family protein n=1 Tax=Thiorhodovibrio TaxID=61593 RepID=UPI001912F468|nr:MULTISPECIES: glycoside hydrolase 100 family protein [Thiorhodovibrio]MBK5969144.1 alkaline invertase [Thiorhodovibrio winogradskyi]WPL13382.1 Plant neutral invertase [Thiorhodovibrio litoralis]